MTMTASQIKSIGQELNKLRPKKIRVDGNRILTLKEAILALAPAILRLKKRNFELPEIVELLQEKGIEIKLGTLSRYLSEFQRAEDKKADAKADKKAKAVKPKPQTPTSPQPRQQRTVDDHSYMIIPDTPLDEL